MGQFEKAIEHYEKGLAISHEIGDTSGVAKNNGNLGIAYSSVGQYDEAIEHYEKGLAISLEIGDRSAIANNSTNLACGYYNMGEYEQAIKHYVDRANLGMCFFKISVKGSKLPGTSRLSTFTYLEKASSLLLESIEISNNILTQMSSDENRASLVSEYFQWHPILAECFILSHRADAALLVFDLGKAKALQLLIEEREQSKKRLEENFALESWKRIGEKEETILLRRILKGLDLKKSNSTLLFYSFDKEGSFHVWVSNGDGRIDHRKLGTNTFAKAFIFHSLYMLLFNVAVNEKNFECKCDCEEADYTVATIENSFEIFEDFGSKKLVKAGVIFHTSSPKPSKSRMHFLQSVIQRYDLSVDLPKKSSSSFKETSKESRNKVKSFNDLNDGARIGKYLYKELIKPIEDLITGTKLIIVPDGIMFFLPFCFLVDERGNYLSERCSIQMSPSIHTLYCRKTTPAQASLGPAFFVGNPALGEVLFHGEPFTVPPLASATEEARSLASRFDTKPLVENMATKTQVLKYIPNASIVHIAAHGDEHRGEIFLSPNLDWEKKGSDLPREKDYLLKERDIVKLQINAHLVVLSCCHTGRGRISCEGVLGVARSFLGAGARSVLVTLWPIHDKATKEFMWNFYDEILKTTSVCEALRKTMKEFQEHKDQEYRSYHIWAPFTIFGEDVRFTEEDIKEIKRQSREAAKLF